ncbi:MAG: hypothetical protein IIC76_14035 [Bacteroidetes bacterium]|nr:hypothetical protein [Bacteroidota bacterium]
MKQVSNKQAIIKRKLHGVYEQIDNEREQVCQGCGRSDKPLSHSHIISQKRCKEIGKTELIWDKDNIEIECFGNNNDCHNVWEKGGMAKQSRMLIFDRKLKYLFLHERSEYWKYVYGDQD